jgi:adenosylcobyric acid synthase
MGRTSAAGPPILQVSSDGVEPWLDGCAGERGLVSGTYVHGLFEHRAARHALLRWLGARKGVTLSAETQVSRQETYDRLADALRANLDLAAIYHLLDHDTSRSMRV